MELLPSVYASCSVITLAPKAKMMKRRANAEELVFCDMPSDS